MNCLGASLEELVVVEEELLLEEFVADEELLSFEEDVSLGDVLELSWLFEELVHVFPQAAKQRVEAARISPKSFFSMVVPFAQSNN